LTLTAPDTKETARISLDGPKLLLDIGGDFAMDFVWQRVDAGKP
jgi:hypothetical protein